jgi:anti-anti-sigma factor
MDVQQEGSLVLIKLASPVDGETFLNHVKSTFNQSQNGLGLGIDLADISFMESSGLGALVSAYKLCDAKSVPIVYFNVQPYVTQLIELTKLDRLLMISPNREAAVQALKQKVG